MQAQDKGGGTPPPIIEVNELLFFYQNMLGILEENILTAICCKTFDLNEIKEARNLLYNSLVTEKEQPNFHKRKSIKTNSPLNEKLATEIYQLFQEYGTAIQTKYAAVQLNKIPMIRSDSMDISGLLVSHSKLEHKVFELAQSIKNCTSLIETSVENQTLLHKKFEEQSKLNHNSTIVNTHQLSETDFEQNTSHFEKTLPCQGRDGSEGKENDLSENENPDKSNCSTYTYSEQEIILPLLRHTRTEGEQLLSEWYNTEEDTHIEESTAACGDATSHMTSHTGEKPFTCNICNQALNNKNDLEIHTTTHLTRDQIPCRYCSYTTLQPVNIIKHLASHAGEKPFACNKCKYRTDKEIELYAHILTHGIESDITKIGDMEKLFSISLSDKHTTTKHAGGISFSCKHCNQSFENQVEMENHLLIHTEKNNIITEDLQTRYSQNQTIAGNLEDPNGPLPHTGEKSICNHNNQSFDSQTNMKKHMLKQIWP